MGNDYKLGAPRHVSASTMWKFTARRWGSTNPRLRGFKPMVLSKKELISRANLYAENREKNMTNKNSAKNTVDPESVTTDALQDPMSGYASADALPIPPKETIGFARFAAVFIALTAFNPYGDVNVLRANVPGVVRLR